MGEDEVATVRTLIAYREAMTACILEHGGRVVDSPGDNLLAEFASVVDAVQCAVDIQQELTTRNAALPLHRRMEFRIGINLGDVLVEDGRLYGDGVNMAARIEALAEAGGICLSGTAYDQVETKFALSYAYLGEHTVKNMARPVRVYRVLRDGHATPSPEGKASRLGWRVSPWAVLAVILGVCLVLGGAVTAWRLYLPLYATSALALPDKPSIVVLPFVNLSDDPQQEYVSDGITEDLITALSKYSGLFVIARTSAFAYKGKAVTVQQVGQELGVEYILEGSARIIADKVRITAQLIEARTGHHLWAERYDRVLADIFTLQDEIILQIVQALQVQLTEGEQARMWQHSTESLEAYELFLRGRALAMRKTPETHAQARQFFEQAIALDPQFAVAYVHLGWLYKVEARFRWSPLPAASLQQAQAFAHKALALDATLPDAYALVGAIYLLQGQHEHALAEGEKALALNPNGADIAALFAATLNLAGRPQEALAFIRKAMRLSPVYPAWYVAILGHGLRLTEQYAEAIAAYKHYRDRQPESVFPYLLLALSYSQARHYAEARAAVAEAIKRDPTFSLERWVQAFPYKHQADIEREREALYQAGLQ
jgi:adenylate cyclase